jgi:prophage regulatory protein
MANTDNRSVHNDPIVILRLPQVLVKTNLGRATIYLQQSQGIFPPSISLGARAVGWLEHEIEAVIQARSVGATDDVIRALIEKLIADRRRRLSWNSLFRDVLADPEPARGGRRFCRPR